MIGRALIREIIKQPGLLPGFTSSVSLVFCPSSAFCVFFTILSGDFGTRDWFKSRESRCRLDPAQRVLRSVSLSQQAGVTL